MIWYRETFNEGRWIDRRTKRGYDTMLMLHFENTANDHKEPEQTQDDVINVVEYSKYWNIRNVLI